MKNGDTEMDELMEFLKYSVRNESRCQGTMEFDIVDGERLTDNQTKLYVTLDTSKPKFQQCDCSVQEGPNPDYRITLTKDQFFNIYSGKYSTMDVTRMILSGSIYVHTWNLKAVSNFANSFDFSTDKWNEYYEYKESQELPIAAEEVEQTTVKAQEVTIFDKIRTNLRGYFKSFRTEYAYKDLNFDNVMIF